MVGGGVPLTNYYCRRVSSKVDIKRQGCNSARQEHETVSNHSEGLYDLFGYDLIGKERYWKLKKDPKYEQVDQRMARSRREKTCQKSGCRSTAVDKQ